LAQQNPGYGWQQFSGPYATFAEGGADMNLFGVPGGWNGGGPFGCISGPEGWGTGFICI
ncbi:MAG: hypothetical protein QOF88_728, partial [Mycobacterium sp.]|nr:hypothetical protein [Mycobacterium sp.]